MMAIRSIIVTLLGMLHVLQCTHIFMETQAPLSSRTDLIRNARALPEVTHEVIFVTKERNSEELNRIFHDVSNPDSPNYGKYLTSEQVAELTANLPARDAIVSYLTATAGIEIVKQTLHGEMITAKAAVAVWEKMFHTEFYYYHRLNHDLDNNNNEATTTTTSSNTDHHSSSARIFIRAESYSLPEQLHAHVFTVLHTVHMPLPVKKFQQPTPLVASHDHHNVPLQVVHQITEATDTTSTVTPELAPVPVLDPAVTTLAGNMNPPVLYSAYNVDSNTVPFSGVTQAVFAGIQQGFSPADLTSFQNKYGIPLSSISKVIGGYNMDSYCVQNTNNCVEGNLDVQYIMATARGAATTWWYTDDESFADFFTAVYNTPNPPTVYTISYSVDEQLLATSSWSEIKVFDAVVQKLSVQGVTIVAASGDNGINTSNTPKGGAVCNGNPYVAQFPASSAYVLAVGATQGAESWAANGGNQVNGPFETVCQSDTGGTITSGGGFSGYYTTPTWQTQAVNTYFSNAAQAGKTPLSGYKVGFRGYPDVSLSGVNYQYYIGGAMYRGSGTSASTPVVAGFITLLNSARLANGLPLLGFVNPLLYSVNANSYYDITSGINNCYGAGASGSNTGGQIVCCVNGNKQRYGFSAVAGWDPATGLGTINFRNLKQAVGAGTSTSTGGGNNNNPTFAPLTPAPTTTASDTPLYLPINGVSFSDFTGSPSVFKNQVANAVSYVLTLSPSQVTVTAVAYNSGRRTRTRALLGTAGQSVLVQMTIRSNQLSQDVLSSLNNAIANGLLTTALVTGSNSPSSCPACITTANVLVTATAVVGTAPTSALSAIPPPSGGSTGLFSSTGSGGGSTSSSFGSCFAGTERVTLQDGTTKAIKDVLVGDRVLTVNPRNNNKIYSDVVAVPHSFNRLSTSFLHIITVHGHDVKMTHNHMLPGGMCQMVDLPITPARSLNVGDCVETIHGRDIIVSITSSLDHGVYTIVAMEELIVVNGIVATPFGGINPALANMYYNLHRVVYYVWGKPHPTMISAMSYLNNLLSSLSLT